MQKKNVWILVAVIVIAITAIGGYAIFHKSPEPAANNSSSTQSNTPPASSAVVITKTDPTLGQYLADPTGRALYSYGSDTSGVSNCTGSCLSAWPAYQDNGSTAGLPAGVSTIKRPDNGQTQYTYNGMPLYYFSSDSGGQVSGNGVSGFVVAKPSAQSSTTTPSSSSSSSSSSSGYPY